MAWPWLVGRERGLRVDGVEGGRGIGRKKLGVERTQARENHRGDEKSKTRGGGRHKGAFTEDGSVGFPNGVMTITGASRRGKR